MNDSASERDDAAPTTDVVAGAPVPPRRVLNPDLLWVESVTERLLGSSGPPTWERAPIGEQVTGGSRPVLDDDDTSEPAQAVPGTFEPAPRVDEPEAEHSAQVHQLPVRTPRPVTRPLSYAEVLADRPRIRLTEEPPPVPYFATTTEQPETTETGDTSGTTATSQTSDPSEPRDGAAAAEPPTAPTAPSRGRAGRSAPGEDMPAGVLRAALRDALPDDTARRSSAVDAIFGDPSWRVAPEPEPAPEAPPAPESTSRTGAVPAAPGATGRPEVAPGAGPLIEEPLAPRPPSVPPPSIPLPEAPAASARPAATSVTSGTPETPETRAFPDATGGHPAGSAPGTPAAPAPITPPSAAPGPGAASRPQEPAAPAAALSGRHRTPDAGDLGADVAAIRMALRSGDENLAAAVLALVADRGRERERVRMVEAYLDAVLAEGDDGLAGAARLRRLLGE